MTLTIVTALADYALDGLLVGVACGLLIRRGVFPSTLRLRAPALLAVFVALDLLWIPAISELQMEITFGNPAVYGLLGHDGVVRGEDLFSVDLLSVVFWLAQTVIGTWTASRVIRADWDAA